MTLTDDTAINTIESLDWNLKQICDVSASKYAEFNLSQCNDVEQSSTLSKAQNLAFLLYEVLIQARVEQQNMLIQLCWEFHVSLLHMDIANALTTLKKMQQRFIQVKEAVKTVLNKTKDKAKDIIKKAREHVKNKDEWTHVWTAVEACFTLAQQALVQGINIILCNIEIFLVDLSNSLELAIQIDIKKCQLNQVLIYENKKLSSALAAWIKELNTQYRIPAPHIK